MFNTLTSFDLCIIFMIWLCIYSIISRICSCFERCFVAKAYEEYYKSPCNTKITELYSKENNND